MRVGAPLPTDVAILNQQEHQQSIDRWMLMCIHTASTQCLCSASGCVVCCGCSLSQYTVVFLAEFLAADNASHLGAALAADGGPHQLDGVCDAPSDLLVPPFRPLQTVRIASCCRPSVLLNSSDRCKCNGRLVVLCRLLGACKLGVAHDPAAYLTIRRDERAPNRAVHEDEMLVVARVCLARI